MKKSIKIFLIILAILLITYLSITIYKFSVIHNIIINDSKNYNSNNFYYSYSYRWPDSDKDLQKVSDVYYKNGHSKNIVYLGKEKQIKYYGDKENNKTY